MLLSNRLRKIRRAQDLTQQELARQAGVNYVTISRIESGEASQVYVETVMRLAKALDVTTDVLLGMDEFQIQRDKEPAQTLSNGNSKRPKRTSGRTKTKV
jgi:transcriptional regulator with XRE-family HTH domain